MKHWTTALLAALCLSMTGAGCGTATRALTQAELDAMEALVERMVTNRAALERSLGDILQIQAKALRDQASHTTSLARAQLLESMRSPWQKPAGDLAATQKEVALYAMYALAEAEREALDARVALREQAIERVRQAYEEVVTLTVALVETEKVLVAQMNPSVPDRMMRLVDRTLEETRAFRAEIATLSDARSQTIHRQLERVEGRVDSVQRVLEGLLTTLSKEK